MLWSQDREHHWNWNNKLNTSFHFFISFYLTLPSVPLFLHNYDVTRGNLRMVRGKLIPVSVWFYKTIMSVPVGSEMFLNIGITCLKYTLDWVLSVVIRFPLLLSFQLVYLKNSSNHRLCTTEVTWSCAARLGSTAATSEDVYENLFDVFVLSFSSHAISLTQRRPALWWWEYNGHPQVVTDLPM